MLRMAGFLVVLSLGFATGVAGGQGAKDSSDGRQEVLNYQLTLPRANQLISAMAAMAAQGAPAGPNIIASPG